MVDARTPRRPPTEAKLVRLLAESQATRDVANPSMADLVASMAVRDQIGRSTRRVSRRLGGVPRLCGPGAAAGLER